MTMNEYLRCIKAKKRAQRLELQQRALMDWLLADLIGKSFARLYSNSARMPNFQEYYSALLDETQKQDIEEKKQERQDELSALRFKQFANSFNKKFEEV